MKLEELKRIIDKAYKTGKGCDVEFYIKLENGESVELDVKGISQFNVIPDVTMNFVPKAEEQSFCLKNNTKETIKYKKEYEKLQKKIKKIDLSKDLQDILNSSDRNIVLNAIHDCLAKEECKLNEIADYINKKESEN